MPVDDKLRGMVRGEDYETSVDAAEAVEPHLSKLQLEVEEAFRFRGPMNDDTLESLPQFVGRYAYSTVRKRRTDLVSMGRLVEVGQNTNSRGRKMIVWDIPHGEDTQVQCNPDDGGRDPVRQQERGEAVSGAEADGGGEGDPQPGAPTLF